MSFTFYDLPILVIGFNRETLLKQQIERLNSFGYKNIYVSIDGPRNSADEEKIQIIRNVLKKKKRKKLINSFQVLKKNLGCKDAVTNAITYFFANVEFGVILEDDILFSESFLRYAFILLERFKKNHTIFLISSNNFFPEIKISESYSFVNYAPIWGWATWADRWNEHVEFLNHFTLRQLKKEKSKFSKYAFKSIAETMLGRIDSWDYLFYSDVIINKKLAVIPKFNLIENVGLLNGTHIKFKLFQFLIPRKELPFPLVHPKKIIENKRISTEFKKLHSKVFLLTKTLEWYYIIFVKKVSNFFQTK